MLIQSMMNTAAHVGALAATATPHAAQVGQEASIIIVGGQPQHGPAGDTAAAAHATHKGQESSIIIVGGTPQHGPAGDTAAATHATQKGQESSIIIVGGKPHASISELGRYGDIAALPLHPAAAKHAWGGR